MPLPVPISDLQIVGYANRLTDTTRPAVVPPIFRLWSEPGQILLPPFVLQQGFVCDAGRCTSEELQHLDAVEEVTLLRDPLQAKRAHELWVDLDGTVRYETLEAAQANLKVIAHAHIEKAVLALQAGDLLSAQDALRIALSADDRMIEPLAIRAAIARTQNDPGKDRLMFELAKGRVTAAAFEVLVDGYKRKINAPPPPSKDLLAMHPMKGMASMRAA